MTLDLLPTSTAWALLSKYGLTVEAWQLLYKQQGGRCAICQRSFRRKKNHEYVVPPRAINVDHDHETGKVRGLLCRHCNFGLGNFRDEVALLARAIVYLEKHGKSYD